MPVPTTCHGCGEVFLTKPSHSQQFCSRDCRKRFTAQRWQRTCKLCGKSFRMKYASEGMYCSNKCYANARRALPADQRAALLANATACIRGKKRSHDDLCKRAQGKQRNAKVSGDERIILDALIAAGVHPVPLFAVDKFNIDFGFPDAMLAVEYHGGNWHNTPKKREGDERKRSVLESLGWRIIEFPRIDKPQNNNSGNRRVRIDELVDQVKDAIRSPRES